MLVVLAEIPYTTFPEIDLGPFSLRTFGVCFAVGVLVGVTLVAREGERWGVSRDDSTALATRMVLAGVIGSRITWVLTHLSQIDNPIDVIAVWEGGLQYGGGFIAALIAGRPVYRRWDVLTRARMLDASVLGLTAGIAIGRIGCYSVGEHLGGPTSFFLATRYDGGDTREGGGVLVQGEAIHNTALYEGLHLVVLFALLYWLLNRPRGSTPSTALGVFLVWYASGRFGTDFLRSYDDTTFGLTGTQFMCILLVPVGLYVLSRVRPRMTTRVDAERDAAGTEAPAVAGAQLDDDEVDDQGETTLEEELEGGATTRRAPGPAAGSS